MLVKGIDGAVDGPDSGGEDGVELDNVGGARGSGLEARDVQRTAGGYDAGGLVVNERERPTGGQVEIDRGKVHVGRDVGRAIRAEREEAAGGEGGIAQVEARGSGAEEFHLEIDGGAAGGADLL